MLNNVIEEKQIFEAVLKVLKHSDEVIQSNLYKTIKFNPNKIRFILSRMENNGFIKRKKFKNTYKLFLEKKDQNGEE